ncbi:hypothetical protein FRC09_007280 [Ceratobasidium sp. 395]|nr:hypothetical protein FRC09_007280 [Ceratobasidium sp. 395]
MDKSVAKKILALENLPRSLASVRLQRTYGHDTIRWPPANAAIENPPTLSFVGYDNVVRTKSADGTCQVTCLDDYDKEIVEHEFMAESVYYSRESNIYVGEDLALIRGPNSEIADLSNYTSDDDNLEGEISSDSSDRESEDSSADTSDDSDSDISVRNSDSDDSLTSGDFYVLSQGQRDSSVDDMEEDEEDENVDASIESSMSSNLDVFL